MQPAFPHPTSGASLVLSFRLYRRIVLIIGSNPLAASRAFSALEADASVIVLAKGGLDKACDELKWRVKNRQLEVHDLDALLESSPLDSEIQALESYLNTLPRISLVFITDTLSNTNPANPRTHASADKLYALFSRRYIPVNTTDYPDLCDFSFTSTYRFVDESNTSTALQVGVTTNGKGCRLAGRIRREVVAGLPKAVGGAVEKVGRLRDLAKAEDGIVTDGENNEDSVVDTPNRPVPSRNPSESETKYETARRRMKWVAQVSEYWPLEKLAKMTEEEMRDLLNGGTGGEVSAWSIRPTFESQHALQLSPPPGKILLVGSGPGHPSLLTLATHSALTKHAQLVLSDKLVPAAVLALIPKDIEVRIARKFPGNADGAQEEMMEAAVDAAKKGLTVVRVGVTTYYLTLMQSLIKTVFSVKTRRSRSIRPSRRRNSLLPISRLPTSRHPRRFFCPRWPHVRGNSSYTTWGRRVVHRLYWGRPQRKTSKITWIRQSKDRSYLDGHRAIVISFVIFIG
jgi:uroporphyrin-III C-methyltransferase